MVRNPQVGPLQIELEADRRVGFGDAEQFRIGATGGIRDRMPAELDPKLTIHKMKIISAYLLGFHYDNPAVDVFVV